MDALKQEKDCTQIVVFDEAQQAFPHHGFVARIGVENVPLGFFVLHSHVAYPLVMK